MKWLGIDIAKRKFDLAVLNNGKIRSKVFDNTPAGHEALLAWLAARGYTHEELHVCMEATSSYYEKLATFLHDAGIRRFICLLPALHGSTQRPGFGC